MWITGEVDLPRELVDAHTDGRLVIFVGAGASMSDPSNLPNFAVLADRIATRAQKSYDPELPPDVFLGQLEAAGVDVHRQAFNILSDPDSRPNANHRALMSLAASTPDMHVITTNYDDHLANAASELAISIPDTYYAPALPLGRWFSGLVHIHGSVRRSPNEAVMTEGDFGRAYLTDAWAARFLERMFSHFSVLFVGYSHDDIVMNYIATGLTHQSERFAFTHDPGAAKWRRLGIQPIGYPAADDHRALTDSLQEWQRRAQMGLLDHRSRVRDIVSAEPPPAPVENDYLANMIGTGPGAQFFAEFARTDGWLDWLEDQPAFAANFSDAEISPASVTLGRWFTETFVQGSHRQAKALTIFQRHGLAMSSSLRDGILLFDRRNDTPWRQVLSAMARGLGWASPRSVQ